MVNVHYYAVRENLDSSGCSRRASPAFRRPLSGTGAISTLACWTAVRLQKQIGSTSR